MTPEEFSAVKTERGITFSAVVAMTPGHIIGKDGGIPWHISEDLKVFKRITTGHPIVMGRKTFDSLGRPLPNRQNIVLTRDSEWQAEGAETIHTIDDLFSLDLMDKHVCIIGGEQIFRLFLPFIDTLWISILHEEHEGDTSFPDFANLFPKGTIRESFADFDLWEYSRA